MAAPRSIQFIALRNLRQTTTRQSGQHQVRSLHMTGPATYASPFLSTSQTNPNVSSTHSKTSSRTKSTPMDPTTSSSSTRNFNTSRHRKQVNDSSPIDFTFFPSSILSPSSPEVDVTAVQVPVLPSTSSLTATSRLEQTVGQGGGGVENITKMKSEVYAVAPDSIILPLSDHASPSDEYMHIDFRGLADKVVDGLDGLVKDVVGGGGKTAVEVKA